MVSRLGTSLQFGVVLHCSLVIQRAMSASPFRVIAVRTSRSPRMMNVTSLIEAAPYASAEPLPHQSGLAVSLMCRAIRPLHEHVRAGADQLQQRSSGFSFFCFIEPIGPK